MLNNKRFRVVDNPNGLSDTATIFEYTQEGDILSGTYAGESILKGYIVGKFIKDDVIKLMFQCITNRGELRAGTSEGKINKLTSGKIKINFKWRWFNENTWHSSDHLEI